MKGNSTFLKVRSADRHVFYYNDDSLYIPLPQPGKHPLLTTDFGLSKPKTLVSSKTCSAPLLVLYSLHLLKNLEISDKYTKTPIEGKSC